eukprot:3441295-Pleurochrysis_carterae.AAC.1
MTCLNEHILVLQSTCCKCEGAPPRPPSELTRANIMCTALAPTPRSAGVGARQQRYGTDTLLISCRRCYARCCALKQARVQRACAHAHQHAEM